MTTKILVCLVKSMDNTFQVKINTKNDSVLQVNGLQKTHRFKLKSIE